MRRSTCFALLFVSLAGAGCSGHATAPPASAFIAKRDLAKEVDAAADKAGVKILRFNAGSRLNVAGVGKSTRDMTVHFVANPEQADKFLRALHAEILRRARDVGALSEDRLATDDPTNDWSVAYIDGHQSGTIRVVCDDAQIANGQLVYTLKVDWQEGPKQVGVHAGH